MISHTEQEKKDILLLHMKALNCKTKSVKEGKVSFLESRNGSI